MSATDPGRSRLKLATAIAAGMLLSAAGAWAVVDLLHADAALLTVGVLLAMQMGLTPHDTTARARCATTALLIVPVAVSSTLATVLAEWRPLEIVVLVGIAGTSTWARRFGPRATALGFAAFFGYFFPMLLKLTPAQLPSFLLVAAIAVASLTLMRALLLVEHPHRQIETMLRELRAASAAVIIAATQTGSRRPAVLRARLARMDGVARAITLWQEEFDTSLHVNSDETGFATLVLDARMDIEQASAELVRTRDADPAVLSDPAVAGALSDLQLVLDNRAHQAVVDAAAARASALLASLGPSSLHRVLLGRLAHSTRSHQALREVLLTKATPATAQTTVTPVSPAAAARTASATQGPRPRWWDWRNWHPTTRLAVQIVVAVSIAAIVGEAISATRWYWAILTAFVVFVSATTRAAILTRAYYRIAGTVMGLAVGIALVFLVHDQKPQLIAICVIATFGVMYFGPVRYLYSALFVTVLLVAMYGLLGELDPQILELRIGETVIGAVIGVLCAYLIFSSNSHPALLTKVAEYFGALDTLVSSSRDALTTPGRGTPVLAAVPSLEAALRTVDTFTASISAAFIGPKDPQQAPIVRLMSVGARAATGLAKSALTVTNAEPPQPFVGEAASALDDALAELHTTRSAAAESFEKEVDIASSDTAILDQLHRVPFDALSPQSDAMLEIARISWAMRQITQENGRG